MRSGTTARIEIVGQGIVFFFVTLTIAVIVTASSKFEDIGDFARDFRKRSRGKGCHGRTHFFVFGFFIVAIDFILFFLDSGPLSLAFAFHAFDTREERKKKLFVGAERAGKTVKFPLLLCRPNFCLLAAFVVVVVSHPGGIPFCCHLRISSQKPICPVSILPPWTILNCSLARNASIRRSHILQWRSGAIIQAEIFFHICRFGPPSTFPFFSIVLF